MTVHALPTLWSVAGLLRFRWLAALDVGAGHAITRVTRCALAGVVTELPADGAAGLTRTQRTVFAFGGRSGFVALLANLRFAASERRECRREEDRES